MPTDRQMDRLTDNDDRHNQLLYLCICAQSNNVPLTLRSREPHTQSRTQTALGSVTD